VELPIFHLSIPVRDLAAATSFYTGLLGATVGRNNGEWADILLFGHQLTLHQRPGEVPAPEQRGVRHFGVILPWKEWVAVGEKLELQDCAFVHPPAIAHAGSGREQGKMLLCDPSDNLIEVKAYRNVAAVLGDHARGGP
jgi:uncharacterized protein